MNRAPGPALPDAFLRAPIAHRGYHDAGQGRVENTLSAFRAAIAAGYGIELDVQMSRDGRAIVFHDSGLDRLTGETGPLRARSAPELERIALSGSSDTIPGLDRVLDLVAGRVPLLIEIKDQDGALGPGTGTLERAVARDLVRYVGPVAVMSFNPHSVTEFARHAPGVARGLTTGAFRPANWPVVPRPRLDSLRGIRDFDRLGVCFISHRAEDLDRPRVAEIKAAGAVILCWTIRDPRAERAARRVAQNITFEGYAPGLT